MMRKKKEELQGIERGPGGEERGHWKLGSWRMGSIVLAQNLRDLIIEEEGKGGMKKKAEVDGREEMERHCWMNKQQQQQRLVDLKKGK